jgi:sugar (pentulose or hexulose) kinase
VCGAATLDWLGELLGRGAGDLHALPPGAGGLLALPYLAGERTPVNDPFASGAVLGPTYSTTRDELCRAFIDAVALSVLDHANRLRTGGVDPARWRAAGGATRNAALLHACCDALGRPLDVMRHASVAIGPAALALRAAGGRWQPSPKRRSSLMPRAPLASPCCSTPTGAPTRGWRRPCAASRTYAETPRASRASAAMPVASRR